MLVFKPFRVLIAAAFSASLAFPAFANAWTLDSEASHLTYLSTKITQASTALTEENTFLTLAGSVIEGKAEITIDLSSVETNIPIRNERMQKHVFNTAEYPVATITAKLPNGATALGNRDLELPMTLSMNGVSKELVVAVRVNATDTALVVTSTKMIVINAADFSMDGGLAKLQTLAGLGNIPIYVPVAFELSFGKSS
ncbi:MAG: YceI family protein [Granulosicoccaceae bacterium]